MKRRILSGFVASIMAIATIMQFTPALNAKAAVDARYEGEIWYDQIDIVEVNRESPHATSIPYQDADTALDNEQSVFTKDAERSEYYKLLSSETDWSFYFASGLQERLTVPHIDTNTFVNLDANGWDTTGWDTIKVPANWQTIRKEDGSFKYDAPIYTNQTYPWANFESISLGANVVAATVRNSVGHYQRTFTLDAGWEDRNTFISFQGVDSAFYVWVDGNFVGYAEDSFTASDFNLTPHLDPDAEEHTLSVQVYRFSTGSYLENQDMIHMSGLFRDVYLYSKDSIELRDYFVTTDLDDTYTDATLNIEANIRNLGQDTPEDVTVEATLYTVDGQTAIWDEPLVITADMSDVEVGEEAVVTGNKEVIAPELWFADDPNLYQLLIEVKQGDTVLETTSQRVGFREISKRIINSRNQEQLLVNGKKIVFRGTNRSEIDLYKGHAIEAEEIIQDFRLMKQFNVNAIRTSHYPNNPITYALADEIGLYICDEANVESHSGATSSDIPSGFPIWINSVVDRMRNMVERDKNHPSIIIWSLGNEATYKTYTLDATAYSMYAASKWTLERDPSRIRKYERDNRYTQGNREGSIVDIRSVQYPTVSGTRSTVNSTIPPYIWSEYAHSMGNALGNFDQYWEIPRQYENAHGGFIWDWIDQSIIMPVEDTYFAVDGKTQTKAAIDGILTDGLTGKALKGTLALPVTEEFKANSDAITLEAWVNTTTLANAHSTIISKGDSSYTLKIDQNNKFEFFVDSYTRGTVSVNVPANFTDGTWKHIVGVCEDGALKIYYNGELLAEGTTRATAPLDTGNTSLSIGHAPDYGRNFNGLIDSVGVYRRGLTAAEVKAAYEANTLSSAVNTDDTVYRMAFSDNELVLGDNAYPYDTYFGYGGDFGETRTDNDFCANGIMFADRTPKPALYQVKKSHQEVSFYDDGEILDGKVRIVNEFLNTDLDNYDITWTLKEDTTVLKEAKLEGFSLAPLEETTIQIDLGDIDAQAGNNYLLVFSVREKGQPFWADEPNHEIAFEQFELDAEKTGELAKIDTADMPELDVNETEDTLEVSGEEFELTFNKLTGFIDSYSVNGDEVITAGPVPNYYRAPVNNDQSSWANFKYAADGMEVDPAEVAIQINDKVVSILVQGTLTTMNDASQSINYYIYGNGDIVVDNTLIPNGSAGDLPRAGMKLNVKGGYENLEYYGRGPIENYNDRNTSQKIGVYGSTVDEQIEFKYVKPQDSGVRTDVLWTSLVNDDGNGIMISSDSTFESSVSHYVAEEMSLVRHWHQTVKHDDTTLTIDMKNRGLGNASCGAEGPWAEYQVPGNEIYHQAFRISPITAQTDKMQESKKDLSLNFPLADILIDGRSIGGFANNQLQYSYKKVANDTSPVPEVSVVLNDPESTVNITQATGYPGTAVIEAESSTGIARTYRIDFEQVDYMYASDMEWSRDVGGYFNNRRDACSCGDAIGLHMGGHVQYFNKGIGGHAPSTVEIEIGHLGINRFQAYVGVNSCQTSATANHIYKVYLDGELAYTSAEMRAGMTAEYIDLDVSGVETIRLYIDPNGGDGNDHGVWADAKFVVEEQELTVQEVADALTLDDIKQGQTQLAMPEVPDGFAVELTASSNETIIALDGKITPPAKSTTVDLTFTVSKGGETAAKTITVAVPAGFDTKILEYSIRYANKAVDSGEVDQLIETVKRMFEDALENAENVLADAKSANPTVTQDDIDDAAEALMKAIHYLDFKAVDKSELINLIKLAEKYVDETGTLYTPATYAAFEQALSDAIKVRDDGDLMDSSEVETAWNNLWDALIGLRQIPDKSKLQSAIGRAKAQNLSLYTVASVELVLEKLEIAENVYKDVEAEQLAVNKVTKELDDAVDKLQPLKASVKNPSNDNKQEGDSNTNEDKQDTLKAATAAGKNPKTGDTASMGIVFGILLLSGCVTVLFKKRSK